jgi:hypothetical protein
MGMGVGDVDTGGNAGMRCYGKCVDCTQFYYVNTTCMLCANLFPYCLTCN